MGTLSQVSTAKAQMSRTSDNATSHREGRNNYSDSSIASVPVTDFQYNPASDGARGRPRCDGTTPPMFSTLDPPDNGQRASRAVGVWSTPGRGCRFPGTQAKPGRFVESVLVVLLASEIST